MPVGALPDATFCGPFQGRDAAKQSRTSIRWLHEAAVPYVASGALPENQFAQIRVKFAHAERLAHNDRQHASHGARRH